MYWYNEDNEYAGEEITLAELENLIGLYETLKTPVRIGRERVVYYFPQNGWVESS